jgi:N-acetylmuramoyl-L-alanine amidase
MLRNTIQNTIFILMLIISLGCFGQKSSYTIKKVVIDAGHGGKDPGATIGKTYEKDIVLDVALKAGKLIKKMYPDVQIIYTRDKDVFIPLKDRADLANKQKADLFISVHVNKCSNAATSGTETYILGQHRSEENLDVAKKENSVILLEDDYNKKYEGFDPNSSESYIMFELLQNEFLEQSRLFADRVQNHFISQAKRKDRGVRQAGFLVLRETAMPSVLIELGFMSNKVELEFLEKEQGKNLMAESIAKSFVDYKNRFDEKVKTDTVQTVVEPEPVVIANDSLNDISKMKGIWYGTQIMSVNVKMDTNDKIFKNVKPIYYLFEKGLYKYFVGITQDSQEALKYYQGFKSDFKGCFLVSFDEGQKKSYK